MHAELWDVDASLEQLKACNRYQAGRINEQEAELQALRACADAVVSNPTGEKKGLKVGWSVQYDGQGRQYWKDEQTGHTQWNKPAVLRQKKKNRR